MTLRSVTEDFCDKISSSIWTQKKKTEYENETLYNYISLHELGDMNFVLSLETTGYSLKQGNRFENSTELPHPKCFLIILRRDFTCST